MDDLNELCFLIENSRRPEDILAYIRTKMKQGERTKVICIPQQNSSLKCPMCITARKGYVDVLKALVDVGFDPRSQCMSVLSCFDSGETQVQCPPLHQACHYGHISVVKTLIEQYDSDVNTPDHYGKPPLLYCIDSVDSRPEDRINVVKYLVNSGADFCRSYFIIQNTPLHYAAKHGLAPICDFLVRRGAGCNIKNTVDRSPLQLAVRCGDAPSARVLLNAGATLDINEISSKGESLLLHAVLNGHYEMLKLLCSLGADPDRSENGKESLLLQALLTYYHCSEKHLKASLLDIIRYLIVDANVDITDDDSESSSAFRLTIENMDTEISTLMVRTGHRLDPRDVNCINFCDVSHKTEVYQFCLSLAQYYAQPLSLSDMCVFRIRRLMCTRLSRTVDELPLPQTLKDVVLLKYILPKSFVFHNTPRK